MQHVWLVFVAWVIVDDLSVFVIVFVVVFVVFRIVDVEHDGESKFHRHELDVHEFYRAYRDVTMGVLVGNNLWMLVLFRHLVNCQFLIQVHRIP